MLKNVVTFKSGSKVTQGHWRWYHSIDCVWFPTEATALRRYRSFIIIIIIGLVLFSNFVLKTHRFWDSRFVYSDLETRVSGHSRSSKIIPSIRHP